MPFEPQTQIISEAHRAPADAIVQKWHLPRPTGTPKLSNCTFVDQKIFQLVGEKGKENVVLPILADCLKYEPDFEFVESDDRPGKIAKQIQLPEGHVDKVLSERKTIVATILMDKTKSVCIKDIAKINISETPWSQEALCLLVKCGKGNEAMEILFRSGFNDKKDGVELWQVLPLLQALTENGHADDVGRILKKYDFSKRDMQTPEHKALLSLIACKTSNVDIREALSYFPEDFDPLDLVQGPFKKLRLSLKDIGYSVLPHPTLGFGDPNDEKKAGEALAKAGLV